MPSFKLNFIKRINSFKVFIFFTLLSFQIIGQHTIKGSLSTKGSGEAVPFATILLQPTGKDTVVNYTGSDLKGNFVLENVASGIYTISFEFIGMQSKKIDSLQVFKNINLGQIQLQQGVELEEIVIEIKKPEAEIKIDRKTFNVAESQVGAGGTATDILNTLPSIDVDEDGTISMRGSANLRILIDGKPTGLRGEDIGLLLKQIPANTIEDIEIITVPNAKYDAESAGGIINIILKKNSKGGRNGLINMTYGNYDKLNTSLSAGYRSIKWDINATYGFNTGTFYVDRHNHSTNAIIDSLDYFLTTTEGYRKSPSHLGKVDLTFRPDTLNEIGLSSNISLGMNRDQREVNYNWNYDDFDITEKRYTNNKRNSSNVTSSILYKHLFTTKSSFNFTSSHSYNDDYSLGLFNQNGELQDETNGTIGNIFTQNLDFTFPIKQLKLEFGGQQTHRTIKNNFNFLYQSTGNEIKNIFDYQDDVTALYLVGSTKLKSWTILAGYRAEYTHAESQNRSTNLNITRFYLNHFPSLSLSKELNKENQINFNYSKRITRPDARQLNPSPSLADPYNLHSGNANLIPATNDVSELSWVNKNDQFLLSTTVFYQLRLNRVRRVRFVTDDGISTVQWVNYKREDYYGFEYFLNWKIKKILSTNFTLNIYQRLTDGSNIDSSYVAQYFGWDAKINTTLKLPKNFSVQLNGEYQSQKEIVIGTILPRYAMDLSLQKTILADRGKLALRLTDVFNTKVFRIESEVNNWASEGRYKSESRVLYLSFSYNFGKQKK